MSNIVGLSPATKPLKTQGEKLEGIAFTFCKVATVALLTGRFALPVAAFCAAGFYIAAYVKGKRDTRCVLHYPLLIAPFWLLVAMTSLAFILNPTWGGQFRHLLPW